MDASLLGVLLAARLLRRAPAPPACAAGRAMAAVATRPAPAPMTGATGWRAVAKPPGKRATPRGLIHGPIVLMLLAWCERVQVVCGAVFAPETSLPARSGWTRALGELSLARDTRRAAKVRCAAGNTRRP